MSKRTSLSEELQRIITQRIKAGDFTTRAALARELGIGQIKLRNFCRGHGLLGPQYPTKTPEETLIKISKLREQGKTWDEVGSILNRSPTSLQTIWLRWMKRRSAA